jgi:shikimate dehydrogenase
MGYLKLDSETMILGVIGYPLTHARVQKVYNALYEKFNVNALYLPIPVTAERLDNFFHAVNVLNIPGFGVTMPHKSAVLPYLDSADEICKIYNCVNTVSVDAGKKKHGYAFDGFAMCQMVEDEGVLIKNRKALVLGAGGISGVVCDELAKRGATEITILNRTQSKAIALAELVARHTRIPVSGGGLTKAALDKASEDARIVMQCTSLGLYGGGQDYDYLGFIDRLPCDSAVADAIYNPDPTALLERAQKRGLKTVNGIGMLACQKQQIFKACLHIDIGDEGKKMVRSIITRSL